MGKVGMAYGVFATAKHSTGERTIFYYMFLKQKTAAFLERQIV